MNLYERGVKKKNNNVIHFIRDIYTITFLSHKIVQHYSEKLKREVGTGFLPDGCPFRT